MSPAALLLTAYVAAIAAASLAGSWLSSLLSGSHTRTQLVISLVAGLILGVALYHLLPHGVARLQGSEDACCSCSCKTSCGAPSLEGADACCGCPCAVPCDAPQGMAQMQGTDAVSTAVWWAVLGVVLMLLLLRFAHYQHDFSNDSPTPHAHSPSWFGIAGGLSVHAAVEGVALGTSVLAVEQQTEGALSFASAGAFLAILLHKPLDALSLISLMRRAGVGERVRWCANVMFALLCPIGALLTFWGAGMLVTYQDAVIGRALALAAGALLCVSLSDLLPETLFHSHDRGKLAVCFLAGLGIAYAMLLLEAGTHDH